MTKRILAFMFALALWPAAAAFGDDFNPPNWRGQPGTSWAQWEFLTDNPTPPPDNGFLPFGPPSLTWTPGTGAGWLPEKPPYNPPGPSGDGWLNLSGELDVFMPNSPLPNPHKEIWIQLTWSPQVIGNVPFLQVFHPGGSTPEFHTPLVQTYAYEQFPGAPDGLKVFHSVYHVDLIPNPDWERIYIRGGIDVDELVIDTWCVPEPSALALLTIGGLLAVRRRI